MSGLPTGIYTISKDNMQLGLESHEDGTPVIIAVKDAGPFDGNWEIEALPNSNVIIRDPKTKKFLGLGENPHVNEQIIVEGAHPNEWQLRQASNPNSFYIVVPGGPVEGQELALDQSLIRIWPMRAALRPLDSYDDRQAWNVNLNM